MAMLPIRQWKIRFYHLGILLDLWAEYDSEGQMWRAPRMARWTRFLR